MANVNPVLAICADFNNTGAAGILFKQQNLSANIAFDIDQSMSDIPLEIATKEYTVWAASPRIGSHRAEFKYTKQLWKRWHNTVSLISMTPIGESVNYHGFYAFNTDSWNSAIGFRGLNLEFVGKGEFQSIYFTELDDCNFDLNSIFVSWRSSLHNRIVLLLLEMERMKWNGYCEGSANFLPFTSGIMDVLVLDRAFQGSTSGDIWRIHLGSVLQLNWSWQLENGINLFDIQPSADIQHWSKYSPIQNESEQYSSEVNRLIGVIFNLSLKYREDTWEINYSVSQIVPLKINKDYNEKESDQIENPPDPGNPGGPGNPDNPPDPGSQSFAPATDNQQKEYGGGFHWINFIWYF